MTIARRLHWYLEQSGVPYDILPHRYAATSLGSAREAHVPAECLAKPVLLEDERGYLMAIVPAHRRVDLAALRERLHREFELASEDEVDGLFHDCEAGAMPALGDPYHVPVMYDDSIAGQAEIYFEAGDHADLVHVHGRDFVALLTNAKHGAISRAY